MTSSAAGVGVSRHRRRRMERRGQLQRGRSRLAQPSTEPRREVPDVRRRQQHGIGVVVQLRAERMQRSEDRLHHDRVLLAILGRRPERLGVRTVLRPGRPPAEPNPRAGSRAPPSRAATPTAPATRRRGRCPFPSAPRTRSNRGPPPADDARADADRAPVPRPPPWSAPGRPCRAHRRAAGRAPRPPRSRTTRAEGRRSPASRRTPRAARSRRPVDRTTSAPSRHRSPRASRG